MATVPITTDIIFQLMLVALFLVFFSMLLNKLLGIKMSKIKELRDKARNIRERVEMAETLGDQQLLQQLQLETMQLAKNMLKKQFLPMLVRCTIFLVIFIVISMTFSNYEGWFWWYFLFSFSFSMIAMVIRLIIKKIIGKEDNKKAMTKEIMQSVFPSRKMKGLHIGGAPATQEELDSINSPQEFTINGEPVVTEELDEKDDWKERLQK